jgi:hypothetical protein
MIEELLDRSSWGTVLFANVEARGVILALILAILAAVVGWVFFHLVAPAHEGVAALVAFVVVLAAVLLL